MKQNKLKTLLFLIVVLIGSFMAFIQTSYFDPISVMSKDFDSSLYLDESQTIENRVVNLLAQMTLEEKIGQMTLVENNSIKEQSDIAKYHLGGLLSGAGSKPETNTTAGWKEMIDGYQAEANKSRLAIPLLYGVDAVHGHAHMLGATVFPHAIGLGASNNPGVVQDVARATAVELKAAGVNWSFSPNLDQSQDIRWGRVYETFSDDPALVSKLGVAYQEGLQTSPNEDDKNVFVLATLKHYIGLGGMAWETSLNENFKIDQGVTSNDETILREVYLPPFREAVEAGALSVMVGLNTWGDKRMVLQKHLLTDMLKQELGFKGFTVSDWYGVHEGRSNIFWATVQAVNAGVDMVMLPFDYKTFRKHMMWANRLGLVSDERIDDAVGRILFAKFALGLLAKESKTVIVSAPQLKEHKELARESVAESLVLLKNEADILPLSPNIKRIRIAGGAADNIGRQMGAWSIEWQGIDGNIGVEGTSILAGIKGIVSKETQVEYDALGNFPDKEKTAIGIAIVGEKPYAEGWGDKSLPTLDENDLLAIKNLQASCDKVIVIIVSGRPLFIADEIDSMSALVAAWLPGSEGGGVADVLFGRKPFTGTLPLPWPSQVAQLPIANDGTTADNTSVLFPRYFGLKQ